MKETRIHLGAGWEILIDPRSGKEVTDTSTSTTYCRGVLGAYHVTTDKSLVTCKYCLRSVRRWGSR